MQSLKREHNFENMSDTHWYSLDSHAGQSTVSTSTWAHLTDWSYYSSRLWSICTGYNLCCYGCQFWAQICATSLVAMRRSVHAYTVPEHCRCVKAQARTLFQHYWLIILLLTRAQKPQACCTPDLAISSSSWERHSPKESIFTNCSIWSGRCFDTIDLEFS